MILECPSCQARFKVADNAIPYAGRTVRCSKCAHQWRVDSPSTVAEIPQPHEVEAEAFDAEAAAAEVRAAIEAEANPVPVETELSPEARVEGEAFLSQLEAVISASEASMEQRGSRPAQQTRPASTAPKRKPVNVKPFKFAVPAIAALWVVVAFVAYFPSWMNAPVLSGIYSMFGVQPTDGLVFSDVTMVRKKTEGGKTKFILAGSIMNHSNETRAVPTVRVSLRDAKGTDIWGRSYPVNTTLKAGEVYPFRIGNVETVFASNVSVIKVDMGNPLQLMVR